MRFSMKTERDVFFHWLKLRIKRRLAYYDHIRQFGNRSHEYWRHKDKVVIPNLTHALQLMELGTYGICTSCKGSITQERLELIPGAIRCTECQKKHESMH